MGRAVMTDRLCPSCGVVVNHPQTKRVVLCKTCRRMESRLGPIAPLQGEIRDLTREQRIESGLETE